MIKTAKSPIRKLMATALNLLAKNLMMTSKVRKKVPVALMILTKTVMRNLKVRLAGTALRELLVVVTSSQKLISSYASLLLTNLVALLILLTVTLLFLMNVLRIVSFPTKQYLILMTGWALMSTLVIILPTFRLLIT